MHQICIYLIVFLIKIPHKTHQSLLATPLTSIDDADILFCDQLKKNQIYVIHRFSIN